MFASQSQAKRFFVEKIVAQAAAEGSPLSDAERQMLNFSESDPEFVVDPALIERLEAEISNDAYEVKVAGLVQRSYERDVAYDPAARDTYREAHTALKHGDHYLLIMIDRALASQRHPWS